jgi:S-adenosylmethionine synthetase
VVTDKVAEQIMEMLAKSYFDKYATVAWITPAHVARPGRF